MITAHTNDLADLAFFGWLSVLTVCITYYKLRARK